MNLASCVDVWFVVGIRVSNRAFIATFSWHHQPIQLLRYNQTIRLYFTETNTPIEMLKMYVKE